MLNFTDSVVASDEFCSSDYLHQLVIIIMVQSEVNSSVFDLELMVAPQTDASLLTC